MYLNQASLKKQFQQAAIDNNKMKTLIPGLTDPVRSGEKPLHLAAKHGRAEVVSLILSRLEGIPSQISEKNAQDEDGRTALHVASEGDRLEVVTRLLGASVNVDMLDKQRRTPLHLAAEKAHSSILKLLLDAYASPKAQDDQMKTPLHLACAEGHQSVAEILLQRGNETKDWLDEEEQPPLFYAIKGCHADLAIMMIDEGASVDVNKNGQSLLWQMASSGNDKSCKLLIDLGADIEARDQDGWTPLYAAAEAGKTDAFNTLVAAGADTKAAETGTGLTLLHRAARAGNINAVNLLISVHVDIEEEDNSGRTPLYVAAMFDQYEAAKVLVDAGAENKSTWLHRAVEENNPQAIAILCELGAETEERDASGRTPLYVAAAGNKKKAAKALIKHNADVAAHDSDRDLETLLHRAAREGSDAAINILTELGADKNAGDIQGRTPLHVAAMHSLKAAEILVAIGSRCDLRDNNGKTPLHVACGQENDVDMIKVILGNGAAAMVTDNNGQTPLHIAAARGDSEFLAELAKMKQAINIIDNEGKTALHIAAEEGMSQALSLLLSVGTNIEARDDEGKTPLHLAALHGKTAAVETLVTNGANRAATDENGHYPLSYAAQGNSPDTIEVLIDDKLSINASPANTEPPATPSEASIEAPPVGDATPRTEQGYLDYVRNFVKLHIGDLSLFTDLEKLAPIAAERADVVAEGLGLGPNRGPDLVKLMLYDFVILCDDSSSMHRDKRMETLKTTLDKIAEIVKSMDFDGSGINIRFLNYPDDESGGFDNMTDLNDISKQVDKVFRSKLKGSELGGRMRSKVVEPFIEKRISDGGFKKPIIAVLITDGQPMDEEKDTLKQVIKNCKEFLENTGYGRGSVIFLLSQVGSSDTATQFLRNIQDDRDIKDMVYCSPERLDEMIRITQGDSQNLYTAKLAELFLAALDRQTVWPGHD